MKEKPSVAVWFIAICVSLCYIGNNAKAEGTDVFSHLTEYLDQLEDRFGVPAWDAAVWQEHRPVFRRMNGYRDFERRTPVDGNEVWWQYSVTKLFTVTAVMQLWEKGQISFDEPVSTYLPEYAHLTVKTQEGIRPAEKTLTIGHLLTMTGGYSYSAAEPAIRQMQQETKGGGKNREIVKALAKVPLAFEPGEHFLYGWNHDVLAAVCEVITGKGFGDFLREAVLAPLGIASAGFHLKETQGRISAQYAYDFRKKTFLHGGEDNAARLTLGHESGGGGLFAALNDVMKLADALSCGGIAANGVRLLQESTVEHIRTNALNDVQLRDFAAIGTVKPGYGYGLGVRTLIDGTKSPGPVGEFGWSGTGGGYVLMDPVNRLSLVYCQQVLNFHPAFDKIHNGLRDALYADLSAQSPL